jgi:hypothetical protein
MWCTGLVRAAVRVFRNARAADPAPACGPHTRAPAAPPALSPALSPPRAHRHRPPASPPRLLGFPDALSVPTSLQEQRSRGTSR